jgi:hypothetical protein
MMTPGNGKSALRPFVGVLGDSVDVMSDDDAALFCCPIEQRRIIEAA